MKKIKTFLLIVSLAFLSNQHVVGQAVLSGPGPTLVIKAGSTINNSFVPPEPDIFTGVRQATAIITVHWIGPWPGTAQAAFSHAVDIWENSLTSVVPIEINANWVSIGPGILGSARANTMVRNFGSSDPRYVADTWFALALANKLNGTHQAPGTVDIEANFNSDYTSFYFGTDGNASSNQYDFVTVVLHEIAHGIGFFSSAHYDPQFGLEWTNQTFPVILDRFITNSSNTLLTSFGVNGTPLENYLQSNDLFFNGTRTVTANGGNAKLWAPTSWQQGSSLGHLDQNAFNNPTNGLMVPVLSFGRGIHNAGPVGIAILNDIGWDAVIWPGYEDELKIYSQGGCCPYPIPQKVLEVGGTYGYEVIFIDEDPFGNYLTGNKEWKLKLIHEGGTYTAATYTGNVVWNLTVPSLPSGYVWHRDVLGRVRAVISVSAMDNTNIPHYIDLPVSIRYKPDPSYLSLRNRCNNKIFDEDSKESFIESSTTLQDWILGNKVSVDIFTDWQDGLSSHSSDIEKLTSEWKDWKEGMPSNGISQQAIDNVIVNLTPCCNSVEVNFFSYAATSYYILYRKVTDLTFLLVQVPVGEYSKEISGLDEFSNYVFYVGAVNQLGGTLSNPVYRSACKWRNTNGEIFDKVSASPNPADEYVDLTLNDASVRIQAVSVNAIAKPQVGTAIHETGAVESIQVPLNELPSGWYAATVLGTNSLYYSVKFYKN